MYVKFLHGTLPFSISVNKLAKNFITEHLRRMMVHWTRSGLRF